MTSQINPNNINGAYPVAGQDNNSQGFRDNFTNTSTNFQYAANEITALQAAAVLNSQISGGNTLVNQNNMNNNPLINALVKDFAATAVSLGNLSGTVTIDYAAGHYQTVTASGNISLAFTNWPIAGQYGFVTLQVTITNPSTQQITFPAAVSLNREIVGFNFSTNTLKFAASGTYTFGFSTVDNGSTIIISENNTILTPLNASANNVSSNVAIGLQYTTSYIDTTGGNITATLAAGVDRQIKVFILYDYTGNATIQVANAGWNYGSPGNILLSGQGQACTIQMSSASWYCIGNNGATFS